MKGTPWDVARLVVADPTFEAILYHAKLNDAEIVKIPLTPSFSHDLPKMMAAAKKGLVYICNPNNPTASISAKNEVREFVEKAPADTMILVDEAYHHYADSPDYESMIPLVKDHPNLIVTRTFSKIYGMAGLRCGYCIAQSQTIERLRERQSWDSINLMALAAATASLEDPDQVTKGRRLNAETRAFTTSELEKMGFLTIPSQANFIMIDVKRPVVPLIATLKSRKVQVGRLFRPMPSHLRVTIGRKSEMEAFLTVFREVTASGSNLAGARRRPIVSYHLPYRRAKSRCGTAISFPGSQRNGLGGVATQASAGAQLGEAHLDGVTPQPFADGFGFGERLCLVRRTCRTEPTFRQLVRRPGAAEVRLCCISFGFTE